MKTKILLSLTSIAFLSACTGAKAGSQINATDFSDSTAIAELADDGIIVTLTTTANNEEVATLRWSKKTNTTATTVRTDDGGQRVGTVKETFADNDKSLSVASQSLHALWSATHARKTPVALKTMDCEYGGYCGPSGDPGAGTTCGTFYSCASVGPYGGCGEIDTVCVEGFADCSTFTQVTNSTFLYCSPPV